MAGDKTPVEKIMFYINLISVTATLVLLILLPSVGLLAGLRFILYVGSILLTILNVGYICAPQNYKLMILKKRLLFVYVPALIIFAFSLFDIFYFIIDLRVFEVISILFAVANGAQAFSFAFLVNRSALSQGSLL